MSVPKHFTTGRMIPSGTKSYLNTFVFSVEDVNFWCGKNPNIFS